MYDQLHARSPEKKKPQPERRFDPLDLDEFLAELAIQERITKLVAYIEMRYWKERDRRGKKPKVSHRTIVLMQVVMGIKDWNLHELHEKLRSEKHGGPLRKLLGLADDPSQLPVYTTFERRLEDLGVYPLKFLMRQWVREAIQKGYIDRAIAFIIKRLQSLSACACTPANLGYNSLSRKISALEEDCGTASTGSHHY